jgi:hypothetical protein
MRDGDGRWRTREFVIAHDIEERGGKKSSNTNKQKLFKILSLSLFFRIKVGEKIRVNPPFPC